MSSAVVTNLPPGGGGFTVMVSVAGRAGCEMVNGVECLLCMWGDGEGCLW